MEASAQAADLALPDDGHAPRDAPAPAAPRRSRRLAIVAFLALVTSLLLPWWAVTWDDGQVASRDSVRVFDPEPPLTTSWGPWLTGALVGAAALVLFVRIAARSDVHEPATWRRDLGIAAGVVFAAVASALLWPEGVPSFWGGRTYSVENVTTQVSETTMPMLGWWVALVAALVLAWAFAAAQRTLPKP